MPPKELSKIRIKLILPEKNSKMDGAESYEDGAIFLKKCIKPREKAALLKKKRKG